jgi:hypothetical protein
VAHFALISDGVVVADHTINNDAIGGGNYPESEPLGQALQASLGLEGQWLQCSWSGLFRGAYPGGGWLYDAALDIFTAPPIPEETP